MLAASQVAQMKLEHAHELAEIDVAVDETSVAKVVVGVVADGIALIVEDLLPYVEEEDTMEAEVIRIGIRLIEVFVGLSDLVEVLEYLHMLPARLTHKQHDRDC
jgi:hypothetical protein